MDYVSCLVGMSNLYIIDNYSTDPRCKQILEKYQAQSHLPADIPYTGFHTPHLSVDPVSADILTILKGHTIIGDGRTVHFYLRVHPLKLMIRITSRPLVHETASGKRNRATLSRLPSGE